MTVSDEARTVSGALHYFRVHPGHWEHRLAMCAALGLDTIETYVPWNRHEPRPGEFHGLDELGDFLDAVARAGLRAIVRPGPYICAEWDNGGLPSWLTGIPGIRLRCLDETYLAAVDRWFDALVPVIAARQSTRGGVVDLVQVENEYGSFGSDADYLEHVRAGLVARGIDVPLFTSDGPEPHMLTGGMVPGVAATVNFGSDPEAGFATLARYRPDDAPFCMEYWCGWFDHWGEEHIVRDPDEAAATLDRILAGGSVNLYMAHGGTNFGTGAGANRSGDLHDGALQPTVTSYDYDAPIAEAGGATPKFHAMRAVIAARTGREPAPIPPAPPALAATSVALTPVVRLFATDVPDGGALWGTPPAFEELGLDHGLVLYRTSIPGPRPAYDLRLDGIADRAHVWVDGEPRGALGEGSGTLPVAVDGAQVALDVLVESMGRTNYGPHLGERKGLLGPVRHERQFVHGWRAYAVDLADLPARLRAAGPATLPGLPGGGPLLSAGELVVDAPGDALLSTVGLAKGYVWVNGFLLGRYWEEAGPQHELFVPGPVLRAGANTVEVLDVDGVTAATLALRPPA